MISAVIEGLGVGFGSEGEMEETELEEGETCSYQNGEDSTIDPDVTLSYIVRLLLISLILCSFCF